MCVKLLLGDLNPSLCLYLTNTYTYRVTIAPRMCGSYFIYVEDMIGLDSIIITLTINSRI